VGLGDHEQGTHEQQRKAERSHLEFSTHDHTPWCRERFDVVLLGPSGDLNGYIELHGAAGQLAAVREDEEFQRNIIEASLLESAVEGSICVLDGG
jgi:hypothetical protein